MSYIKNISDLRNDTQNMINFMDKYEITFNEFLEDYILNMGDSQYSFWYSFESIVDNFTLLSKNKNYKMPDHIIDLFLEHVKDKSGSGRHFFKMVLHFQEKGISDKYINQMINHKQLWEKSIDTKNLMQAIDLGLNKKNVTAILQSDVSKNIFYKSQYTTNSDLSEEFIHEYFEVLQEKSNHLITILLFNHDLDISLLNKIQTTIVENNYKIEDKDILHEIVADYINKDMGRFPELGHWIFNHEKLDFDYNINIRNHSRTAKLKNLINLSLNKDIFVSLLKDKVSLKANKYKVMSLPDKYNLSEEEKEYMVKNIIEVMNELLNVERRNKKVFDLEDYRDKNTKKATALITDLLNYKRIYRDDDKEKYKEIINIFDKHHFFENEYIINSIQNSFQLTDSMMNKKIEKTLTGLKSYLENYSEENINDTFFPMGEWRNYMDDEEIISNIEKQGQEVFTKWLEKWMEVHGELYRNDPLILPKIIHGNRNLDIETKLALSGCMSNLEDTYLGYEGFMMAYSLHQCDTSFADFLHKEGVNFYKKNGNEYLILQHFENSFNGTSDQILSGSRNLNYILKITKDQMPDDFIEKLSQSINKLNNLYNENANSKKINHRHFSYYINEVISLCVIFPQIKLEKAAMQLLLTNINNNEKFNQFLEYIKPEEITTNIANACFKEMTKNKNIKGFEIWKKKNFKNGTKNTIEKIMEKSSEEEKVVLKKGLLINTFSQQKPNNKQTKKDREDEMAEYCL